jgi:sulfite reductase (ferredoxin)
LTFAQEAFEDKNWADAIYHAYAGFVNGAKALLLSENEKQIIKRESLTYLTLFF